MIHAVIYIFIYTFRRSIRKKKAEVEATLVEELLRLTKLEQPVTDSHALYFFPRGPDFSNWFSQRISRGSRGMPLGVINGI